MKHGTITLSDMKLVWRIMVSVIICQMVGSVIGLAIAYHHFSFMNLWFGGVCGTLPGYVIGLSWQIQSRPKGREWMPVAGFFGFLAVALTVAGFFQAFPMMRDEMDTLDKLAQIQSFVVHCRAGA